MSKQASWLPVLGCTVVLAGLLGARHSHPVHAARRVQLDGPVELIDSNGSSSWPDEVTDTIEKSVANHMVRLTWCFWGEEAKRAVVDIVVGKNNNRVKVVRGDVSEDFDHCMQHAFEDDEFPANLRNHTLRFALAFRH